MTLFFFESTHKKLFSFHFLFSLSLFRQTHFKGEMKKLEALFNTICNQIQKAYNVNNSFFHFFLFYTYVKWGHSGRQLHSLLSKETLMENSKWQLGKCMHVYDYFGNERCSNSILIFVFR